MAKFKIPLLSFVSFFSILVATGIGLNQLDDTDPQVLALSDIKTYEQYEAWLSNNFSPKEIAGFKIPCNNLNIVPTPFTVVPDPPSLINPTGWECGSSDTNMIFPFTLFQINPFQFINPDGMEVTFAWDGPQSVLSDSLFTSIGGNLNTNLVSMIPPGEYIITFCFTDLGGDGIECCTDHAITVTGPSPTVSASQLESVCAGDDIVIEASDEGPDAVYNWDIDGGNGVIDNGPGPFNVNWDDPGEYTIAMIAQVGACTVDTVFQSITVVPCVCDINTAIITNAVCNPGNLPSDPSDDTFTFSLELNGDFVGDGWTSDDPDIPTGTYGVEALFGPFPITDPGGIFSFIVTDNQNPDCSLTVIVNVPETCSNTCAISIESMNIVCDDQGTFDPSDDSYTFDLLVEGANSSMMWIADDPTATTGNFGVLASFGPFPADQDQTITLSDAVDADCSNTITIPATGACSPIPPCDMIISTETYTCESNGTIDNSDDTFVVELNLDGSGVGWTADDPNNSAGQFGQAVVFGPFNITDTPFEIIFSNDLNASCNLVYEVSIPQSCLDAAEPCSLTTATACDDGNDCTINDMEVVLIDGVCVPCQGEQLPCGQDANCEMVVPCGLEDPCLVPGVEIVLISDGTICEPCDATIINCDNGETLIQECDDNNPETINDLETVLVCSGEICVPCQGVPDPTIRISNIISQSSSQNNEWLVSFPQNFLNIEQLNIFDRYGNLVHSLSGTPITQRINMLWDGRFGNELVLTGVYVYQLRVIDNEGNAEQREGTITVVR